MPNLLAALPGISGILVTPFDRDDRIAPERLRPIIHRAIAAGVHILTVNGNTGEFYGLASAEAEAMVHAVAEEVAGRVPVVAGVGRSIGDAIALARTSRAAGASALMVHQPPDPFVAPRGVVAYVRRIADAADGLPVVLYLRNDAIGLDAIEALCRIPEVVGVKWASPAPLRLAETWAPPLCAVGARGFTSGLINVWPEHSVAIHAALVAGDYPRAGELIAQVSAFEELRSEEGNGTNVTVVKSALQMMGEDCGGVRPPGAWPLTDRQAWDLRHRLTKWGLLAGPLAATG